MTIGERIKALRKKNNLTQEELADYLCVTYQAVSKWENGGSSPDLALIVPLAKIFHVTTDELLGATLEDDKRYTELKNLYNDTYRTGDMAARIKIVESAIKEYPTDMNWLNRYAWDIWCMALDMEFSHEEHFEEQRERAIKLFDTVIKNTNDDDNKIHAINGIVQCLCGKGCKKEAKQYAEMLPLMRKAYTEAEKEMIFARCLEGDEQIQRKQEILYNQLIKLLQTLLWDKIGENKDTCEAAEGVLRAMIPDGNYCDLHHCMSHIQFRKAEIEAKAGNGENTVMYLQKSIYHAKEYDLIDSIAPGQYAFTAPLFDHWKIDSDGWFHNGNGTLLNDIKKMSERKCFDFLRESDKFQAIFIE